jgi:type II secretory pathway predicted ATPase ExeA
MYERHFLFSQRPFAAAPVADAYLPTGSLEQARQTLIRFIDRGEGLGLVVGPAGTGKSLLCQMLAKHFRGRFQVAHLCGARLGTRRALLQNVLFELKLPYRDMDEGELRLSLVDHLEPRSGGPDGLLLLVDEAHTLPLRLLEEIRLLTNIVRDGQSRVRLVMAGGMALEERLTSPKLDSFHQRIAARCYLQPLSRDETIFYVREQVRRCGASADAIFSAEAQTAVHTATDGIPRLINQVCDHALMLAAVGGRLRIEAAGIEEAWADFQQLPVPLHETPVLARAGRGSAGGTIEFGQLGEEPKPVVGSVGPSPAEAAAAGLDAISQTIEALADGRMGSGVITGTAADDFSPAAADGTEVELIFHTAHDPFGGQWEEEEVVIDRYASLEDAAVRGRRVTSDEGRALSAAVSAAARELEPVIVPAGRPDKRDMNEDAPVTIAASGAFHPASDPLMPEEPAEAPRARRAISLATVGQDDRDMIVVDDEQPERSLPIGGRPRRSEYRQLFSTLRKG